MRREDLDRFYTLLDRLGKGVGGPRRLNQIWSPNDWPTHGVYFFFEDGEMREDGASPRVTRVGTHAVSATSRTTLWNRLRAHKGTTGGNLPDGGNHRGSIFRLHVGAALLEKHGETLESWGVKSSASRGIRTAEHDHELLVSSYIRSMPFLWLEVPGAGGPGNARSEIETNSIALLSNLSRPPIDPPSPHWLGCYSTRESIRNSGLWNVQHLEKFHESTFLDRMETLIDRLS